MHESLKEKSVVTFIPSLFLCFKVNALFILLCKYIFKKNDKFVRNLKYGKKTLNGIKLTDVIVVGTFEHDHIF